MKIVLSAVVLGSVLAPAFSLSYLESLGGSAPAVSTPAASGASYLTTLNSPSASAPTGSGMASYLDALPQQPQTSGGGGLASYTDNLGGGAAAAPVAAAPAPVAAAPAPVAAAPASSGAVSSGPTTAGYLDAIHASASSGAPTGAGMVSYLDTVPRTATAMGGAGIQSYTAGLPVTNTATGTGSGLTSYTDNLSGGRATSGKSYSMSGNTYNTPSAPSFAGSVGGTSIDFTLEASDLSALIAQLQGNGGTIRLTGSIDAVSFN